MLELQHITIGYGDRILLEDISASFIRGRLTAMLGRNGSGKSTLMRTLLKMRKPSDGNILIDGKDINRMGREEISRLISFVGTERIRIANLKCQDLVALGRAPYTGLMGMLSPKDREMVENAFEITRMQDYVNRTMDRMSDGECQRIMIARALAQNTPVMILDEPTAFLDVHNRYSVVRLLHRLASENEKTIIFSTHDLDIALKEADEIFLLNPPKVIFGPTDEIQSSGILDRVFGL